MDRTLSLGDTAFDLTLGVRPHVLFHHLGMFDEHLLTLRVNLQHASLFALVAPRDYLDNVVFANICTR
jgi:hypothetical protein